MNYVHDNSDTAALMMRILAARFTNLGEMQQLCKQLLDVAEPAHDTYSCTFANLYLLECHHTRGDYESCQFYMMRAQTLCEENGYDDLLLTLHGFAGLYYLDVSDEQSALKHYLQGLELARQLRDPVAESKLLNHIGTCFRRRGDHHSASMYFRLAHKTLEPHLPRLSPEDAENAIGFLCNLAEVCQHMQKVEESEQALHRAAALPAKNPRWHFRLAYAQCGHLALCQDRAGCAALAAQLLEDGLETLDDVRFKTGAFIELCDAMLAIESQDLALRYLLLLRSCCGFGNLGDYYSYQLFKTRYYERFGTEDTCDLAYREFYEISTKISETDNAIRVQNVLSKLALTKAVLDRESVRRENKALEDASHMDGLTQLYNRRYLSKLISKVTLGSVKPQVGYIMLDVDYFKQYNDFYGHFKGDGALQCVAAVLNAHLAEGAYPSRYGGDEFLVLCVNWSAEQMESYIRQVQADLAARQVPHERSAASPFLSLSIGFSCGPFTGEHASKRLLELADQALYLAKEEGRNRYAYATATGCVLGSTPASPD